jgi:hypothetical protein
VWRFIDEGVCRGYPDLCESCDMENSSYHVLFVCPCFDTIRDEFLIAAGVTFSLDALAHDTSEVQHAICRLGRNLFNEIARRCCSLSPTSSTSPD